MVAAALNFVGRRLELGVGGHTGGAAEEQLEGGHVDSAVYGRVCRKSNRSQKCVMWGGWGFWIVAGRETRLQSGRGAPWVYKPARDLGQWLGPLSPRRAS